MPHRFLHWRLGLRRNFKSDRADIFERFLDLMEECGLTPILRLESCLPCRPATPRVTTRSFMASFHTAGVNRARKTRQSEGVRRLRGVIGEVP